MQVRSAGGIVFWGWEVLVLTNFRGDTVFPKGHLEQGETPEQADSGFVQCDGAEIIAGRYVSVEQAGCMLTYDLDREKLVVAYGKLRQLLDY